MVTAGGGSIVNISSVNGFVGAPGISGYVTSKFGIRGLTRTAALELGRSNIRVNSIHPGPIDTAMVQPQSWGGFDMRPVMANMMPLGRIGRPDEVAEMALWLAVGCVELLHRRRVRGRRRIPRRRRHQFQLLLPKRFIHFHCHFCRELKFS